MTDKEALDKAKSELALSLYLTEAGNNTGMITIHSNRCEWLSRVIAMAERNNTFSWVDSSLMNPEDLPENAGKKSIPCIVAVKSRYKNGKPNIEKRMRRYDSSLNRWLWSKHRGDGVIYWASLPYPKEYVDV